MNHFGPTEDIPNIYTEQSQTIPPASTQWMTSTEIRRIKMSKAKTPFHANAFITWSCVTCCWETTAKKINFHNSEENITLLKFITPWFIYPIDHGHVEIIL